MKRLFKALVALIAMGMATGVSASVIQTYSDELLFSAATSLLANEDFESYAPTVCGDGGSSTFVGTHFSAQLAPDGSAPAYLCVDATPASQPTPQRSLGLEIGSTDSWVFTVSLHGSGISAVSMLLTDIAENNGSAFLRLVGHDDILIAPCCLPDGSSIFFGFMTDKPISEFQIVNTGTFDGWGLDDVRLGTAKKASEPAITALLALGLFGAAASRRRSMR
jgi:hypothetical protein